MAVSNKGVVATDGEPAPRSRHYNLLDSEGIHEGRGTQYCQRPSNCHGK